MMGACFQTPKTKEEKGGRMGERKEGWGVEREEGVVSFADCPQGMMTCLGPCDCNVSMYDVSESDGKCLFSLEGLSFCVCVSE